MRKKIVAGNWKMNKTLTEGIELIKEVNQLLKDKNNDTLAIFCTPFIHLAEASRLVDNKVTFTGAQNCSSELKGAFTGEISAEMIVSTGAKYVIIGHSERRTYYKESNQVLNKKVKLAIEHGLHPIFCIGEMLEEREKNIHFDVIKTQLYEGVFNLTAEQFSTIIIAYEPVWAIGTGKTATSQQAQEMHKFIRETIAGKYGKDIAQNTTIQYGGSCNAQNAKELFSNPDVDGGLIGGASLKAADFVAIVKAF